MTVFTRFDPAFSEYLIVDSGDGLPEEEFPRQNLMTSVAGVFSYVWSSIPPILPKSQSPLKDNDMVLLIDFAKMPDRDKEDEDQRIAIEEGRTAHELTIRAESAERRARRYPDKARSYLAQATHYAARAAEHLQGRTAALARIAARAAPWKQESLDSLQMAAASAVREDGSAS